MAARINELKERVFRVKQTTRDLWLKTAAGGKLTEEEQRSLAAAEKALPIAERELLDAEQEAHAEDALLAARLGIGSAAQTDDVSLSALPPLPTRTRRALASLFQDVPSAAAIVSVGRSSGFPSALAARSGEDGTDDAWRGIVAAALGGQPFNSAVLAATATEGVPSDGGYAVPVEVVAEIFARAIEESVFLRIGARLEPMRSETKIVNALDDYDETDDVEASLTAAWTKEATEAEAQVMKLRRVELHAHKLMILAAASNELSEDAPRYVRGLRDALMRSMGKKLDRSCFRGTGAGMPLGLTNSPATITVEAEDEQLAGTFLWQNAANMWARLAPGSHERSWWLMHPTVLPQGLSMTLPVGTGGIQPRGAFEVGGPTGYQLLGRPVVITSRVEPLGTKGDVTLLDPTQVAVGVRRQLSIAASVDALFSSDRLAIRGTFRGDARPLWDAPRTLADGTTTVSPVVMMEAR